jgi:hypothetical protein
MSAQVRRGRPRRPLRIPTKLRLSALAACALSAAVPLSSAQAADPYRVVGTGGTLHVHTSPTLGSQVTANLPDGTPIHIACQTRGDNVIRSGMWDRIDQPVSGYIADWYTSTPVVNNYSDGFKDCVDASPIPTLAQTPAPQPPTTPQPTTTPRPPTTHDLASIALSYVGQRNVPAAIPRSWAVGPHWSGNCEAFVGWVTTRTRGRGYQSAYSDYEGHRGRIHSGVPPRNTVVYWYPSESHGAGHIGISLGGGYVVSTVGLPGGSLPIARNRYRAFGHYLGWANP